jgi:hypothetical protein
MSGGAALAAREVNDHVDGRHEDDEIAERDDLPDGGHGNDVSEHHQLVVVSFEVASSGELDVVLGAGFDDVGVHEGFGTDRHALVDHDRDDVGEEADGHDAHAGEMQVRKSEAGEQRQGEEHQRSSEVADEA